MDIAEALQQTAAFIKQHRSNEANFPALKNKLHDVLNMGGSETLQTALAEAAQKADAYAIAKEKSGSAWPEFEKFVTAFERTVLGSE